MGSKKLSFVQRIVTVIGMFVVISSYLIMVQNTHTRSSNSNNKTRKIVRSHLQHIPNYQIYNETDALKYLFYSKAAFCTDHAITTWSCGGMCDKTPIVGTDKIRYIPEGSRFKVQGYVAQIPSRNEEDAVRSTNSSDSDDDDYNGETTKCVVAFRGSLNAANWYADVLAALQPWPLNDLAGAEWCPGCKAHYGFTMAYDELRETIHDAIADLGCTRLVLAGHSLGAAIATIASFDLRAAMGYHVEETWTFGKPRIGNTEFVTAFGAAAAAQGVSPPLWRVVHYHDPVPRAPPTIPGLHPVAHEALEVYYTSRESSEYRVCPQEGAVENPSRACSGGWPLFLSVNMDHVSYLNESFAFKNFPEECKAITYE